MALKFSQYFSVKGCLDTIDSYRLSTVDYNRSIECLRDDVDAFFINGLITLSSSINSLNKENFSWSFIQSYYSVFYLARAFNGINNYAILYHNRKPYGIHVNENSMFEKLKGNSHDVVLSQFKNSFKDDILLTNSIENNSPVDWFNEKRNCINYTLNPLSDPNPPIEIYEYGNNLRKWIATYISDQSHSYTFDPVHCFLSYPLQLFNRIFEYYTDNDLKNRYIDQERIDFFKKNFCDSKGPISLIITRIEELLE